MPEPEPMSWEVAQSCSDDLAFLDKVREENVCLKERAEKAEAELISLRTGLDAMIRRRAYHPFYIYDPVKETIEILSAGETRLALADKLAEAVEKYAKAFGDQTYPGVADALRAYLEGPRND